MRKLLLSTSALLLGLLLSGCGQTPPLIRQYVFEYVPLPSSASARITEAIKVKRFAAAQAFDTTAMVYRPEPLQAQTYRLNRWRVNPGAMVTDYLVRDLRRAGLFEAVFSHSDLGHSRFVLEGGVEEIQELDESDCWKAALALTVTLLDTSQGEITRRLVFQKSYRTTEPMLAKTPQGLAEAMSRAMQGLSQKIVTDVYQAVRTRMGSDKQKKLG